MMAMMPIYAHDDHTMMSMMSLRSILFANHAVHVVPDDVYDVHDDCKVHAASKDDDVHAL